MKLSEFNESTRKLNPAIFGPAAATANTTADLLRAAVIAKGPPLKQSHKPKLNQTEREFRHYIAIVQRDSIITDQSLTFRLANGVSYRPDFVTFCTNPFNQLLAIDAFEVKDQRRKDSHWFTDDARVKLKLAAKEYPFIRWFAAWKEGSEWKMQRVAEEPT